MWSRRNDGVKRKSLEPGLPHRALQHGGKRTLAHARPRCVERRLRDARQTPARLRAAGRSRYSSFTTRTCSTTRSVDRSSISSERARSASRHQLWRATVRCAASKPTAETPISVRQLQQSLVVAGRHVPDTEAGTGRSRLLEQPDRFAVAKVESDMHCIRRHDKNACGADMIRQVADVGGVGDDEGVQAQRVDGLAQAEMSKRQHARGRKEHGGSYRNS